MSTDQPGDLPPSETAWEHYCTTMHLDDTPGLDKIKSGWTAGFEAGWHQRGRFEVIAACAQDGQ